MRMTCNHDNSVRFRAGAHKIRYYSMLVILQSKVELDPEPQDETHEEWESGDIIYF